MTPPVRDEGTTPFAELLDQLGTRRELGRRLEVSPESVGRWARGGSRPDAANRRRLLQLVRDELGRTLSPSQLAGIVEGRHRLADLTPEHTERHPPDGATPPPVDLVTGARLLTQRLHSRQVPETSLEWYWDRLSLLCTEFVHLRPAAWFPRLLELWELIRAHLDEGAHPRQSGQVHLLGALTGAVLAHGCHVMGRAEQALVMARMAQSLAEAIGHRELAAWALGTRALVTDRLPRRPPHAPSALTLIEQAQSVLGGRPGTGAVRLHLYRAAFAARTGDTGLALRSRIAALRARDRLPDEPGELDVLGGILTLGHAKHEALAASALLAAGNHADAADAARQAITAYDHGPAHERSWGDLAIARLDLAAAHAARGDHDAAAHAARPVLDLDEQDLLAPLLPALHRLAHHLGTPTGEGRTARELRQEIATLHGGRTP
ncbi:MULTISPECIES: hypothetical protein [Actinosynnema]|uniref:hypothetical protein n=1 Tax=Actinosynnema TaxID=40566 RepID=UPI0020A2A575|nr:hypothetical protein [Actinosynnema pretiosum]MCP2097423.1 hypothetical protein [Actinosynnema pretiosum]